MGRAIILLARLVGFCFGDMVMHRELVLAVLGAAHGMPGLESRSASCKCTSHCNIALSSPFFEGESQILSCDKTSEE